MTSYFQNDEELWQDILAGDEQAFAIFYDRYWLRMYKAALHYLKDKDASEEVVQEVFILIWNKRKTLDIKNFAAYLNTSTRYEVFRKLRAVKRSFLEFHEDFPSPKNVAYNDGDERLREMDNHYELEDCLKDLPKRCREIFYLSKIKQLTNNEISDQLGISKHTVENQLAIALKHLKLNFTRVAMVALLITNLL